MTSVLVDTSALYAALDRDDARHADARSGWTSLLAAIVAGSADGLTHSGIVVETTALVQRRLGMDAVRALHVDVLPMLEVEWVDAALHGRAVAALIAAGRRDVSLVDWTSFELMRAHGIRTAFAFDVDFRRQGFVEWASEDPGVS